MNQQSKCKRKAAEMLHYPMITPIFNGNEKMKTISDPSKPKSGDSEASFATLPPELFCRIIAFLGPTSHSLCTISQVTREHNAVMRTIGDVMLQRAKLRFRVPLPPKSDCESSVSLFVRHARVSKDIHDKLEVLDAVILLQDNNIVKPTEVDCALDLALCLLRAGEQNYNGDVKEALKTAENAATTVLEWRVFSVCGQLGAKAYKYSKARLSRYYEQGEVYSSYAVSDEMPSDESSDDEQDLFIHPARSVVTEEMERLGKASLVIQLVVLRNAKRC